MRIFGDSNCWGGSFFHLGTGWVFNTTSTFVWLCVCSYLFWQLSTFTFNSVLIKHALFGLKTWLFCMFSRFLFWSFRSFDYPPTLFTFSPCFFLYSSALRLTHSSPDVKKSVIWPSFCLSVSGSSDIPWHHGDMTIPNDPQSGCVCVYNIIILGMVIIPNHGPIIYIYIYIYIYVIHNNTTFDHGIMAHAFLSLTSLTSQQLSSWPVHLCWLWAVNLLGHGFSIPDFAMMGIQFSTNNCCFFDNFWTL